MALTYPFNTKETPGLAQIGGKALSLVRATQAGLLVPPGFVLSAAFFEPWLARLRQSPEWAAVLDSAPEMLKLRCEAAKALALAFELDPEQQAALAQALPPLQATLLAVRSSSPEEDLEGASFAGGYETLLGVTADRLEAAVRRAFASCLDERVLLYKREHGFAVENPRIAVIVQQQIASETAGVAFSLNPLNNCYDEAVINANFGLGESVVSGRVSPDQFVVDKTRRALLEKKTGKKETSVWLDENGGTSERPAPDREGPCLSEAQVLEVAELAARVESHYGQPMDIEWAYAGGRLYLLQARPITAYFHLPEALHTAPGAPRQLYWDLTLSKWGMAEPVSVMGTDYLAIANTITLRTTMGMAGPEVLAAVRPTLEGRVYINASNSLKMQGKKRATAECRALDTAAAEILESLEDNAYVAARLPSALNGMIFRVAWKMLRPLLDGLRAVGRPETYEQRYLETLERYRANRQALAAAELPLRQCAERTLGVMIDDMPLILAVLLAAQIAKTRIARLFKNEPPETRNLAASLEHALPHNVTIEMGLALVHLARFPEIAASASEEAFLLRLRRRDFSGEFLQAWDRFMEQHGVRGPMEMDPATPRLYERPAQLFRQLRALAANPEQSQQAIWARGVAEREQAYTRLLEIARGKGQRQARQFEKDYRILMALAGFRETPKYCLIQAVDLFRRRALALGQKLAAAGRLGAPEQIFDLHLDEAERALAEPRLDLQALRRENTRYLGRYRQGPAFPRLIDSRGQILRAPRKAARPGELAGDPISPGVARGPAKVLRTADEKPVLPGDILVTRATDPGWTPLFINAAGIVLEVGGMLQHGALVAREYGKPCVAGLEAATTLLKDGQMVEVDGAAGIVRVAVTE